MRRTCMQKNKDNGRAERGEGHGMVMVDRDVDRDDSIPITSALLTRLHAHRYGSPVRTSRQWRDLTLRMAIARTHERG
jgi:hypothetical protein